MDEVDPDRQEQIEQRPSHHDGIALPERPGEERPLVIVLGNDLVGILAEQAQIAAEGKERQPVFGGAGGEAEQARPKAEREAQHLDAEELGHQEVPKLVRQDEHA